MYLLSSQHVSTVWVKKIPPWGFVAIFPKWLGIFQPNFTCLLCVPIYARLQNFLFNYLQLWWSYAILSVTTQFTSCAQNVHQRPKRTLAFSDIFPKQLGIFSPKFTRLLNVHIYTRIQIFIQLSPTMTKLCHIKCDNPACVCRSMVDILSTLRWSRLIWHNCIKVAHNWIKKL